MLMTLWVNAINFPAIVDAKSIIPPGSSVYDPLRHAENIKRAAQETLMAENTLEMLQLRFQNLIAISQQALSEFKSSLDSQISNLQKEYSNFSGSLNERKNAKQVWNDFDPITDEQITNHQYVAQNSEKRRSLLENTYKDSFSSTKTYLKDVRSIQSDLLHLIDQNNKTEGNLDQKQLNTISLIKRIEMQQQIVSQEVLHSVMTLTKVKSELQTENIAERINRNLKIQSADPYNPTEKEKQIYTRKSGQGYLKFNQ